MVSLPAKKPTGTPPASPCTRCSIALVIGAYILWRNGTPGRGRRKRPLPPHPQPPPLQKNSRRHHVGAGVAWTRGGGACAARAPQICRKQSPIIPPKPPQ